MTTDQVKYINYQEKTYWALFYFTFFLLGFKFLLLCNVVLSKREQEDHIES